MTVTNAARKLIGHVMVKHGLTDIAELECPHMRALAEALRDETKRPRAPRRGIGVHSNADMLRGR